MRSRKEALAELIAYEKAVIRKARRRADSIDKKLESLYTRNARVRRFIALQTADRANRERIEAAERRLGAWVADPDNE